MWRTTWILLSLSLSLASQAWGTDVKSSLWCDSRTRDSGKTYSLIFTLHHDVEQGTCTAIGESGEYGASAAHEFDCRIEATEKRATPLYRIELKATKTTIKYGEPGRAAVSFGIFHDFNGQFGQGLARLQDNVVMSMTCIPGPFRHP